MATVSKRLRYEILRRDNHACRYCGARAPEVKLVVDAVTPEALGGSHKDPANLVTACDPCNSGKSATPPDAALVADVQQDAFRWSQAMTAAAAEMLAKASEHVDAQEHFAKSWKRFGSAASGARRKPLPMDANWRHTVDQLLAAGLPLSELEDCIDIAMSKRNVREEHVFRYMCGVAWNKVTAMQARAQELLSEAEADTEREWTADLACTWILKQCDPDQIDRARKRGVAVYEGDEPPVDSVLWFVVSDLQAERDSLIEGVRELLRSLPGDVGIRALAEHEAHRPEKWAACYQAAMAAAEHMSLVRARAEMAGMPRSEYEHWVQLARDENAAIAEHLSEAYYVSEGARMARGGPAFGEA